ncbi:MAG TPA: LysM peptidoglycan-binding domain-containing protein [Anaerolineales bacterium]|nr:LysM peptidoglycan-binding domain-containing protein [Anaerolineales bacterium]
MAIPSENGSGSTGGGSGSAASRRSHTVRTGENLTIIAIKYGTTVAAIASANNIANINNISVGQVLIIP